MADTSAAARWLAIQWIKTELNRRPSTTIHLKPNPYRLGFFLPGTPRVGAVSASAFAVNRT